MNATAKTFSVGTLVYTKAGLMTLFGWLLRGDFVFMMMENVMPNLLPLQLKQLGATNEQIAVIVTSIGMMVNTIMNPIVSYQSDAFRSRWGRRRPFIVATTPLVVIFLAAIPYSPEILAAANRVGWISQLLNLSPVAPVILIFGMLVVGFQIFNTFVGAVYYYLIPDVVPKEVYGQFYGLFRVIAGVSSILFNYCIFGLADKHMREIFVVISILYGVFMMMVCWQVKEGEYPPPPHKARGHWWGGIENYLRECFGYSYYLWAFLVYSAWIWSTIAFTFAVFFYKEEAGFSTDGFGKLNAYLGVAFIFLAYPFGILLDRLGSHKTFILCLAARAVLAVLAYFLIHKGAAMTSEPQSILGMLGVLFRDHTSGTLWYIAATLPYLFGSIAIAKWTVDVYPADRYGQFGSAGAAASSLGAVMLSPLCGWIMDSTKIYRNYWLWIAVFCTVALVAEIVTYKRWKALGGADNRYAPP